MASLVRCSRCNRQLRIPDSLFGKWVKCPACSREFLAEAPDDEEDHPDEEPVPRRSRAAAEEEDDSFEEQPEDEPEFEEEERPRPRKGSRRKRAKRAVQPPAIVLMVLAGLALLLGIWNFLQFLNGSGLFAAEEQRAQAPVQPGLAPPRFPAGAPKQDPEQSKAYEMGRKIGLRIGVCSALIWPLVVLLGAYNLLTLGNRMLAFTGAIFAMLPCSLCCLGGLPVGIWALVVLNRPEVTKAFNS